MTKFDLKKDLSIATENEFENSNLGMHITNKIKILQKLTVFLVSKIKLLRKNQTEQR